jgi:hypothetical protein
VQSTNDSTTVRGIRDTQCVYKNAKSTGAFSLTKVYIGSNVPEEVTLDDMTSSTGQHKNGFNKIRFCEDKAMCDALYIEKT